MLRHLVLIGFLTLASCAAPVGAAGRSIPADAGQTCVADCGDVGMRLTGIVTMAGTVGCVCEPQTTAASDKTGRATAMGGTVAVLIQEEEQRRQQQQQQQQYRR